MTNKNNETIMTRDQVRAFDRWAIEQMGIPGVVLMENAGLGCVEVIVDKLNRINGKDVCIVCGPGNNGGDGYVIARHLMNQGFGVHVYVIAPREKIKGDALIHLKILEKMGSIVHFLAMDRIDSYKLLSDQINAFDLIIDAIFGTGLSGTVRENMQQLIDKVNRSAKSVIAIDIPSGLDCDSGQPLGTAIQADSTITFVAVKKGFICPESKKYTGTLYVASIGIEADRLYKSK